MIFVIALVKGRHVAYDPVGPFSAYSAILLGEAILPEADTSATLSLSRNLQTAPSSLSFYVFTIIILYIHIHMHARGGGMARTGGIADRR